NELPAGRASALRRVRRAALQSGDARHFVQGQEHRRNTGALRRRRRGVFRGAAQRAAPGEPDGGRRPGVPLPGPTQPDALRRGEPAHQAGHRTCEGANRRARRRHGAPRRPAHLVRARRADGWTAHGRRREAGERAAAPGRFGQYRGRDRTQPRRDGGSGLDRRSGTGRRRRRRTRGRPGRSRRHRAQAEQEPYGADTRRFPGRARRAVTTGAAGVLRVAAELIATLLLATPSIWGALALNYQAPGGRRLRAGSAVLWSALCIVWVAVLWQGRFAFALAGFGLTFGVLLVWWRRLTPSN